MCRCISYFDEWGFLIWILIVFLFKFVFTLNKAKDNIFCLTKKQTGGTEWHRGHWLRKVSGNGKTTKFLEYGKCLETGKRQNPLNTESVQKQGNNKIPWIRKVSGNRKTTKSFESAKTSLTRGAERPFRCLDCSTKHELKQTEVKGSFYKWIFSGKYFQSWLDWIESTRQK